MKVKLLSDLKGNMLRGDIRKLYILVNVQKLENLVVIVSIREIHDVYEVWRVDVDLTGFSHV